MTQKNGRESGKINVGVPFKKCLSAPITHLDTNDDYSDSTIHTDLKIFYCKCHGFKTRKKIMKGRS